MRRELQEALRGARGLRQLRVGAVLAHACGPAVRGEPGADANGEGAAAGQLGRGAAEDGGASRGAAELRLSMSERMANA